MTNEELNNLIDLFFGETGKAISNMTKEQQEHLVDLVMEELNKKENGGNEK